MKTMSGDTFSQTLGAAGSKFDIDTPGSALLFTAQGSSGVHIITPNGSKIYLPVNRVWSPAGGFDRFSVASDTDNDTFTLIAVSGTLI